jgi:hypothetical protein
MIPFGSLTTMDPIQLFSDYLKITGVAHTGPEPSGDPRLIGKRLGLLNGGSWVTLWANFFGRIFVPGAHLVNVGNEAVQINFMQAYANGDPVPPTSNIKAFVRYALDLVEFAQVDAVLITCSTMNRSYQAVEEALKPHAVPVLPIDRPMMESAVKRGGRVLVVATHGPTVANTQALLQETAQRLGKGIEFSGLNVEEAWYKMAVGDVFGHNQTLAEGLRRRIKEEEISSVVFAQLSMSIFLLSYPDPLAEFGIPVFTSGQCGFEAVREILIHGLPDQAR